MIKSMRKYFTKHSNDESYFVFDEEIKMILKEDLP